jgi:hypothetical protein
MFWRLLIRLYDEVEAALWALLVTSVIFIGAFVVPRLPDIWANIPEARTKEIAADVRHYCKALRIKIGMDDYSRCVLLLGEFRQKIEERVEEEYAF